MKSKRVPEHTRYVLRLVPSFAEFLMNFETMDKKGKKLIAERLVESCSGAAINDGLDLLEEAVRIEESR